MLRRTGSSAGGAVLFEEDGRSGAALIVDPLLTKAPVMTSLAREDGNGNPVTVELDASGIGTGKLEHTTTNSHDHSQAKAMSTPPTTP